MTASPTLGVHELHLAYETRGDLVHVLREVSLDVQAGEVVGLVGESGSGKSTIAYAVMRFLSTNARILSGDIQFEGQSLLAASETRLSALRGKRIAMVYQDPNTSLNPTLPVGQQIAEVLQQHYRLSRQKAWGRATELLSSVSIGSPEAAMHKYPHQFSGGEKQRVLIAMAFSCKPSLLILDEPTTALDPTTAAGILDLIRELQRETRVATLYITHNLATVAEISQRLYVIYAGKVVETGPTHTLLTEPRHPYTRMLLASVPDARSTGSSVRLASFSGPPPDLRRPPRGCVFQERCPFVKDECRSVDVSLSQDGHAVSCIRVSQIDTRPLPGDDRSHARPDRSEVTHAVLVAEDLSVTYRHGSSWSLGRRRSGRAVRAVRNVSFQLGEAQTLALVGESGSGKSSLARALVGLETATGTIRLNTTEFKLPSRLDSHYRQSVQIIFQNPDQSLNPRQTIETIVARPLAIKGQTRPERRDRIHELMEQVRLPVEYLRKYPHELSGGEKQRVAIARAFATAPAVVICDEVTSALDVSVQASIVNLLSDLQDAYRTSYLFISHDLNLVHRIADQVAVMYLGRIVEAGATEELFKPPYHPYTEALLSAVPTLQAGGGEIKIRLDGDPPSPARIPAGCPFNTRCPRRIGRVCDDAPPPTLSFSTTHRLACHIPPDELIELASLQDTDGHEGPGYQVEAQP